MELISREALIERFSKLKGSDTLANMFVSDVIREIKNQPPVDAVPVVHGEWIDEFGKFLLLYKCSKCSSDYPWKTNFCPNCGCDMKGKK